MQAESLLLYSEKKNLYSQNLDMMCDRTYPLSQVVCTLILFDGEKILVMKKNLLVPSLMVGSYGSILQTSTDTSYAETYGVS